MIQVIVKISFIRVERVLYEKRNETIFSRSVAVLSLVVAGCSQSTSTSDSAKETTQVAAYHKADCYRLGRKLLD